MKEGIPEFKTYSERPITDRQYLGGGRYGDVYKVKYTTGEADPEKGKQGFKLFAEKKFKTFTERGSSDSVMGLGALFSETTRAEESAKKSVEVHSQLKELEIPTWVTYRLSGKGDRVLMSLKGADEDSFLILPNNKKDIPGVESDHQRLTEQKVEKIDNLESVVDNYIDIFANLEKIIRIRENDSVGIVYEKDTGKIEVLFADLDSVSVVDPKKSTSESDKYFQRMNMGTLKYHVIGNIKKFIEDYMADDNEKKREYLELLEKKTAEIDRKIQEFPRDPEDIKREESELIGKKIDSILNDKLSVIGWGKTIYGNIWEVGIKGGYGDNKFIFKIFDATNEPRSFGIEELEAEMANLYLYRPRGKGRLKFLFTEKDEKHSFFVFKEEH